LHPYFALLNTQRSVGVGDGLDAFADIVSDYSV